MLQLFSTVHEVSMNSLRTQIEENILGNDSVGHDVITLDCELIDLAYHVPAHAPEEMDESEDFMIYK